MIGPNDLKTARENCASCAAGKKKKRGRISSGKLNVRSVREVTLFAKILVSYSILTVGQWPYVGAAE